MKPEPENDFYDSHALQVVRTGRSIVDVFAAQDVILRSGEVTRFKFAFPNSKDIFFVSIDNVNALLGILDVRCLGRSKRVRNAELHLLSKCHKDLAVVVGTPLVSFTCERTTDYSSDDDEK